jgi:hypothetical protein
MQAWEKEQMLYMEIHNAVERVVRENTLTYFQIFGALEQVKTDYQIEFRQVTEDIFDEDDE